MSKPYSRKSRASSEKLTAEFTSGEMVIGICIALFIAVACFLAGVLVGRLDRSTSVEQFAADLPSETLTGAPEPTPSPSESPAAAPSSPSGEGVQTTPLSPNRAARQTYTSPEERTGGPRSVELAPPPASGGTVGTTPQHAPMRENRIEQPGIGVETTAPPETPAPTPAPEPETPPEAPEAAASPEPEPMSEPTPEPTAPESEPEPDPEPETSSPAPSATPDLLTPLDPVQGRWAVQLANLTGNNRQQRAQDYAAQLRREHNLTADVVESDNGAAYLVAVTGYPNREAALRALEEIRKLPELEGAFLKELP